MGVGRPQHPTPKKKKSETDGETSICFLKTLPIRRHAYMTRSSIHHLAISFVAKKKHLAISSSVMPSMASRILRATREAARAARSAASAASRCAAAVRSVSGRGGALAVAPSGSGGRARAHAAAARSSSDEGGALAAASDPLTRASSVDAPGARPCPAPCGSTHSPIEARARPPQGRGYTVATPLPPPLDAPPFVRLRPGTYHNNISRS